MTPAQRSRLFRELNDRIYDLLASAEPDLPGEFLCECGRECGRRVELLPLASRRYGSRAGLSGRGAVAGSSGCVAGSGRAAFPR